MREYWQQNSAELLAATGQHAALVFSALGIALVVAVALSAWILLHPKWRGGLVYFFSLLYAVPSFAFFVLLLPLTGLGAKTAVIVLATYSEYILLRSFLTGLTNVDPTLIEVARGLGMTRRQVLVQVRLPQAWPAIFSGLQVALASTMGIATIAATIDAGGLGSFLFAGLATTRPTPIIWGTLLTVGLTLVSMAALKLVEWLVERRYRLD